EADLVRRQHAQFFLGWAEEAEEFGPSQRVWLERFETEHDNFRAALTWGVAGGRGGGAARLARRRGGGLGRCACARARGRRGGTEELAASVHTRKSARHSRRHDVWSGRLRGHQGAL